jgi:hypothetical protein
VNIFLDLALASPPRLIPLCRDFRSKGGHRSQSESFAVITMSFFDDPARLDDDSLRCVLCSPSLSLHSLHYLLFVTDVPGPLHAIHSATWLFVTQSLLLGMIINIILSSNSFACSSRGKRRLQCRCLLFTAYCLLTFLIASQISERPTS